MKATDQYLKYVRWEADDAKYVGYCPDLFPWGGVCHGATEEETYRELCRLVAEEVNDLMKEGKDLPKAETPHARCGALLSPTRY